MSGLGAEVPQLPTWSAPSLGGKGKGSSKGKGSGKGKGSNKGSTKGTGKGASKGAGKGSSKGSSKGSGSNKRDRPGDLEKFDFLKVGARVCCYLKDFDDWFDGVINGIQIGLERKETFTKFYINFDDGDTGK